MTKFHYMSGIEKSCNHKAFKLNSIIIYFAEYQVILEHIQFETFVLLGIKVLPLLNRHFPPTYYAQFYPNSV